MAKKAVRIGIVAASSPYSQEIATRVERLAAGLFPENPPELIVHPNSFRTHGHFAGTDSERAAAFLEIANVPEIDALWVARGGWSYFAEHDDWDWFCQGQHWGKIKELDQRFLDEKGFTDLFNAVSYTHLTLPTTIKPCRSRWSRYH